MRKPSPVLFLLLLLALAAAPVLAVGPSATITGPTSVTSYDTCVNVSWTCSGSGGVPPYVYYTWKVNGVVKSEGAGASGFTKRYCTTEGVPAVFNDTVSCTVTDSDGREGTTSIGVTVTFP